jgi:type VI secretion system protein ImpJ
MINGIVMRFLSKVVWSEGMYLGPHHFQAQNRYFEDSIRLAVSSFWSQPYGLLGCSMNEDALRNGTLSLVHARGMFEDGMLFLMPDCDALPSARAIADLFPPTRDRITIMLGVPKRKPGGLNCSLSTNADGVRYSAEDWNFRDETTGGDERPGRTFVFSSTLNRLRVWLLCRLQGLRGMAPATWSWIRVSFLQPFGSTPAKG